MGEECRKLFMSKQRMKIGIMQPYFFPYLGYWQLINAVDKYVVYDDVSYIKGGWISRNNILLNGNRHLITLPLEHPSSFRNINEINITSAETQRNKLIKTIESAYRKAPYFDIIMPMVEDLVIRSKTISELNYTSILLVNRYLNIDTEILLSSELDKKSDLKGQEKVIHITKLLKGDTYINAIGGKELYSPKEFSDSGIELLFLKMGDVGYKQYSNIFVPNLSIIDVLMFNSCEEVRYMLDDFSLVG